MNAFNEALIRNAYKLPASTSYLRLRVTSGTRLILYP